MLPDELFRECDRKFDVDLGLMWAIAGLCEGTRSMGAVEVDFVIGADGRDTREKGARLLERFSESAAAWIWPPNCMGKSFLASEAVLLWWE